MYKAPIKLVESISAYYMGLHLQHWVNEQLCQGMYRYTGTKKVIILLHIKLLKEIFTKNERMKLIIKLKPCMHV